MDLFSISQLARYSGVKPHTIRIWEQRYNALHPSRSEGNTRYYDSKQLRRLLNIVSLKSTDLGLRELCAMSDRRLFELILKSNAAGADGGDDYFISQLISAGINYDEGHFNQMFSHCLLRYGLKNTYLKVIYPMLVRVGLLWTGDSFRPSYEHFISNMLRRKLSTCLDALPPPEAGAATWLLFLPENEFHDIGLMFADYLIRMSGARTVYLGGNMPESTVIEAIDEIRPENLLLFLVHLDLPDDINQYLGRLVKSFKGERVYVSGNAQLLQALGEGKKLRLLKSVADLEGQLSV
jgi:MerR family transcriptional regulator, light-induced transcriptional regulator